MYIHASSVAIHNMAVLIAGATGVGKSDLALRLIDAGAKLIADDQTMLSREGEHLIASAQDNIKGLIEVRHVGLLRLPFLVSAEVALFVELVDPGNSFERLPDKEFITLMDIRVRHLHLPAYAASTPAKIRAVLAHPDATDQDLKSSPNIL